jgi:hypothetical protein
MYNASMPDKFHVEKFILSSSKMYEIYHLDIYQGKNATNVGIHETILDMPTTQKAVLNAVLATGIENDPDGACQIVMDNWYACCELLHCLESRYQIQAVGMTQMKRKGWPSDIMNLKKSNDHGTYKLGYDSSNCILSIQLVDLKVVSLVTMNWNTKVSTNQNTKVSTAAHQVGRNKIQFPCPAEYNTYGSHMFGVDKGDQIRGHFGGFARCAHFQKWYKKVYLLIIDCMLLNAWVAWGLSMEIHEIHNLNWRKLVQHEFMWIVSQEMLDYHDTNVPASQIELSSKASAQLSCNNEAILEGYQPVQLSGEQNVTGAPCIVCRLEYNMNKSLVKCPARPNRACCDRCRFVAHTVVVPSNGQKIFDIPEFKGLLCFEIAHSELGKQIWKQKNG